MAGPINQSESDVVYRRLAAVCLQLRDVVEEIDRLDSERISLNLATNLDPESKGNLDVADATALFGEIVKYRSWFNNETVAATGAEGSNDRRATLDPFLLAEPLLR